MIYCLSTLTYFCSHYIIERTIARSAFRTLTTVLLLSHIVQMCKIVIAFTTIHRVCFAVLSFVFVISIEGVFTFLNVVGGDSTVQTTAWEMHGLVVRGTITSIYGVLWPFYSLLFLASEQRQCNETDVLRAKSDKPLAPQMHSKWFIACTILLNILLFLRFRLRWRNISANIDFFLPCHSFYIWNFHNRFI